ncbi:UNVERIFIED_ORG: cobyrinic acid a,c-diamide synthase [Methylobacterium sp. SuP10 SLI 274]|uniref:cobyrinate a,c-diamide synthase n=1 Tax=Methylorubrum extorquens TaxID=408 RepID=UPI00209D58EB|nr:cobyrinate a,c-diamide synthase [Methylorubrum extorquens]MDF9861710.1 cobyrinic acid a,c-diamide synthase [Methylorubrum pseudosasae]MDH6635337.1 cobyrinic acid a,c-diamide synthase [Methylobacterium sp. SuP10 SLI 274]MDH6664508.1 cobyrinic acid a,c-diamide synthase [Methylorubrum zatmanii]MCP1561508.1 cobyrinic acid a,c-diamide synthase [Methylorubrum extorquens]MDF9790010.1 cobyrinic acid a,c-diamide synthase [Methylorubrum extorquens]
MTPAPGLLVAAPRSGSGKTTVTLALMRALRRQGVAIRGAKCGPDYIDPAFHEAATGLPSLNLDSFAMPDALLDACAGLSAREADLVVAEGSMGLHDGIVAGEGRTGANADIAARYGWPVVLVLDVSGAAQSAAAVALGCAAYDSRIRIAGVILNKVASPRHRRLVEAGLSRVGLPVLGAFPREASLVLPERHLGLVQAGETADLYARLDRLADLAETSLDLDAILAVAGGHAPVATDGLPRPPAQRIAVARDAAFSFLYPHMLAGWRAAGAEIVPFSPLADEAPGADCDACWLPGGYPELHAGRLAAAQSFLGGLRDFAQTRPVHGECGGYMVLGESLEDADGLTHPMCGLLPVATSYRRRKLHLGYRVAHLLDDGLLGTAGTRLVGHEFHYASELTPAPGDEIALARVTDAEGVPLGLAGHRRGRVTGSFFHLIAGTAEA